MAATCPLWGPDGQPLMDPDTFLAEHPDGCNKDACRKCARPQFGDHVRVKNELRRRYEGGKKVWRPFAFSVQPWVGIFLGYRTLYDGRVEWIGEEEGNAFIPTNHYRVALVCRSERHNPVYVALEDVEVL